MGHMSIPKVRGPVPANQRRSVIILGMRFQEKVGPGVLRMFTDLFISK